MFGSVATMLEGMAIALCCALCLAAVDIGLSDSSKQGLGSATGLCRDQCD
jgi:hypothetical protein